MNLDRSHGAFDLGMLLITALVVVGCTPGPEFEVRIRAYTCELPAGYTDTGACAELEKFVGINYARLDKQRGTAVMTMRFVEPDRAPAVVTLKGCTIDDAENWSCNDSAVPCATEHKVAHGAYTVSLDCSSARHTVFVRGTTTSGVVMQLQKLID